MAKKKSKISIMRSIPEGGMLTLPLSEECYQAWYVRACEVNKSDGYHHYTITRNRILNTLTIISNLP